MPSRFPGKHTVFLFIFTAGALAAVVLPLPLAVRGALAAAYFAGIGAFLGRAAFPGETAPWQALFGFLVFASSTLIGGSAVYYLHRLDKASVAILLAAMAAAAGLAGLAMARAPRVFHAEVGDDGKSKAALRPFSAAAGVLGSAVAAALIIHAFTLLAGAATELSIRSPWDAVPRMFFVIVFIAVLAALAASLGALAPRAALVPIAAIAVLAVSVAAVVYVVGFGFDPFIHQATEKVIFARGEVTPKPLYYVGQYALVTIVSRLLGGHVVAVDVWAVPAAFALLVPCAYWCLRRAFDAHRAVAAASSLGLLLLPLSSFAATTPQGLANVLFLMTALLSLPAVLKEAFPRWALFLLAAATAAIHPLAGIPLLVFVALLAYMTSFERSRGVGAAASWLVILEMALVGSVALPVVFIINSALSGTGVALDTEALRAPSTILEDLQSDPVITRQFQAGYDLVYAWKAWRAVILLAAAAAGVAIALRRSRAAAVYLVGAVVFLANFVLLKSVVKFPFLISYERSNYADRIFELTLFLLAPAALAALAFALRRVARSYPALRIGTAVLLAALVTSSVYLAYPRRDKYESSRGWSTSGADVETVRLIEDNALGAPYAVLANQSISAAAVREFGFRRYFASKDPAHPGALFYYPIPTGDALYARFLDMNAAYGSRAAAEKAMDLVGVDLLYYAVPYYWWEAQRIIVSSKREADRWWSVDDKVYVFKYVRK